MLALIFTRKLRPMIIGSLSGWLMLAGMMARPARDLVAHEFRRDLGRDRRAEGFAAVLAAHELGHLLSQGAGGAQLLEVLAAAQVLADGDELHLRRDEAAARVMHLRHVGAGARAARPALQVEAQLGEPRVGEALHAVARGGPGEELRVAALGDPAFPQGRQPGADVDARRGIGVGAAGVVHVDRRIGLGAEGGGRIRLRDGAHRHADVGARALDMDLARGRQRPDGGLVDVGRGGEELGLGVHCGSFKASTASEGARVAVRPTLPTPA